VDGGASRHVEGVVRRDAFGDAGALEVLADVPIKVEAAGGGSVTASATRTDGSGRFDFDVTIDPSAVGATVVVTVDNRLSKTILIRR
jgi:hypothetical protein